MTVYVPEEFTPGEEDILRRYFTNLDGPVFALVNLPEVVKGALFARYSRSPKSLRRLFLEALQELRDRYLISFAPAEPIAPGWHKVAVRLDDVKGDVLARPGYWVPSGQ